LREKGVNLLLLRDELSEKRGRDEIYFEESRSEGGGKHK
jgi:hypothetical protein